MSIKALIFGTATILAVVPFSPHLALAQQNTYVSADQAQMKSSALVLIILAGRGHAATGWDTFTSQYSGCSLSYPNPLFVPNSQVEAGGRTSFRGTLPSITLVIGGGTNIKGASIAELMRSYFESVQGETITYRRQEKQWAVYSGFRNGLIYYMKAILSANGRHACVFELTYPPRLKRDFDSMVGRISGSLRLPGSDVAAER